MEKHTFKKIDCLTEWVAVVNIPAETTLELTEEAKNEFNSEGVVVGMGADAKDRGLNIGDRVIVTNRNHIKINPSSGGYADKTVYILKIGEILTRKDPADNYEVV